MAQGAPPAGAIRGIGVGEAACHGRRNACGGLTPDPGKRLTEPKQGNTRLRRALCGLTLDKRILHESLRR